MFCVFSQKTDAELQTEKFVDDMVSVLKNPDYQIVDVTTHSFPGIPYKVKVFIKLVGPWTPPISGIPGTSDSRETRTFEFEANAAPVPYEFNK